VDGIAAAWRGILSSQTVEINPVVVMARQGRTRAMEQAGLKAQFVQVSVTDEATIDIVGKFHRDQSWIMGLINELGGCPGFQDRDFHLPQLWLPGVWGRLDLGCSAK
jgi:hypothetical protein